MVATNVDSDDVINRTKNPLKRLELEELHCGVVLHMSTITVKVFNLYQQMLSPALFIEWNNIVDKLCFTKGWLADMGIKSSVKYR